MKVRHLGSSSCSENISFQPGTGMHLPGPDSSTRGLPTGLPWAHWEPPEPPGPQNVTAGASPAFRGRRAHGLYFKLTPRGVGSVPGPLGDWSPGLLHWCTDGATGSREGTQMTLYDLPESERVADPEPGQASLSLEPWPLPSRHKCGALAQDREPGRDHPALALV